MVDAICLSMVPPYDSTEQNETNNNNSNTNAPSAFRRSLNLSHSAFGLRRFSRSNINDNATTTTPTAEGSLRRRATISSSVTTTTTNTANTTEPEQRRPKSLHVRIVPNIENPSRSLIFDIFDRELQPAVYIKFGRFTDRSQSPTHMSFKSKVVSRSHCEIWVERNKLYIRDTKSSSGTFLNHIRISPPNEESRPHEIRDGDIVQLGVDYQGGVEEIYRSVKMKFEVNRMIRERPVSYTMSAFQNIRNLTTGGNQMQQDTIASSSLPMTTTLNNIHDHTCITSTTNNNNHNIKSNLTTTTNDSCIGVNEIEECCICLYALAPHQALFVSPCAHTYHYKCIRPLLESYPGFQCPICRTYSDLEANIHMESHEVIEKYGLQRQSTIINHHHSHPPVNETSTSNIVNNNNNNINHSSPLPSPSSSSSSSSSDSEPSPTSPHDLSPLMISPTINYLNENNTQSSQPLTTRDNRQTIIMDHTINNQSHETNHQLESDHSHTGEIEMTTSQGLTTTNFNSQQEEETEEELENNNNMMMMTSPDMEMNVSTTTSPNSTSPQPPQSASSSSSLPQQQQQTTTASSSSNNVRYPKRSNGTKFVEKLKMVFLEKRKSSIILAPRERKRSNRPRPLSYPHFLRRQDEEEIEEDAEQQQQQQNVILQRSSISNDDAMSTSYPLSNATTSQILSRQSTHLAEIEEVDELPWHNNFNQFRQPMSVD